jgi:hypothetical protein
LGRVVSARAGDHGVGGESGQRRRADAAGGAVAHRRDVRVVAALVADQPDRVVGQQVVAREVEVGDVRGGVGLAVGLGDLQARGRQRADEAGVGEILVAGGNGARAEAINAVDDDQDRGGHCATPRYFLATIALREAMSRECRRKPGR